MRILSLNTHQHSLLANTHVKTGILSVRNTLH